LTKRNLYVNTEWLHDLQNFSTASRCRGSLFLAFSGSPHHTSGTTFTNILRSRGPSNSHKKMPCHLPSISFPSSTKLTWLAPARTPLACESELPSLCR